MSASDPEGPERVRRVLREVSETGLDGEAARRIADRAWARAAALRTSSAARGSSPVPGLPAARLPRFAVAGVSAAAALVLAAVLVVRSSAPAFAVDGDPVQVLEDDRWGPARAVPLGSWVYVPVGTRSVSARDGGRIEPQPGSVFRIVRSLDALPAWRVELRRGDAEVSGTSIVLAVSDQMEVVRSLESGSFRVHASLGAPAETTPSPDALGAPPDAEGRGVVRVLDGEARVADGRGGDLFLVRPREAVTTVDVGTGGRRVRRLAFERGWSAAVPFDILRGASVLGADVVGGERGLAGDVALAVRSPGARLFSIRIPGGEAPLALAQANLMTLRSHEIVLEGEVRVHWAEESGAGVPAALPPAEVVEEFEHRAAGRKTTIRVHADGTATLDRDGAEERFASVAALRAAVPEAVAPFGEKLR